MKAWIYLLAFLISSSVWAENSVSQRINLQKRGSNLRPPQKMSSSFQTEKNVFLAKKRKLLIREIKNSLKTVKDPEQIPELQLRLANLYMEDFKSGIETDADRKQTLAKALGILQDIFSKNPTYRRIPEVLFQLAQIHLELAKTEKALSLFETIVTQYSDSPFVEESTLQIADYNFDKGNFDKALKHFSQITRNPSSPLAPYSFYKIAWAFYNLGKPERSLENFKAVIENETAFSTSAYSLNLKKEAIRDVCLPFTDLKKYEEGVLFYQDLGEDSFRAGLECLATLGKERGDYPQAVELYKKLLALDSTHKKNPEYSLALFEIYKKKSNRAETLNHLREALAAYLGNSTWKEIFSSDAAHMSEIRKSFQELCQKEALETHSIAQTTKDPAMYDNARDFYELYLEYFSLAPDAPKMEFYLAEIWFKKKEFLKAAEHYTNVFKSSLAATEIKREALHSSVLSYAYLLNADRKKSGLKEVTSKTHAKRQNNLEKEPESFTEIEEAFLKTTQEFLDVYPQDKVSPELRFQMAYLHYSKNSNQIAETLFWEGLKTHPSHETSKHAGLLLLDILNQSGRYSDLVSACSFLLKQNIASADSSFRNEVSTVLRQSELKRIAQLEEESKFKEAANGYLKFFQTYGSQDDELSEKALFNAAICFDKAEQPEEALRQKEQFLKKYPKSQRRQEVLLQLAKAFEGRMELDKSAFYFELFQKDYPKAKQAPDALRLAGIYYWGAKSKDKAESILLRSLQTYPQTKSLIERDLLDFYQTENLNDKKRAHLFSKRETKGLPASDYLEISLELADKDLNPFIAQFSKVLTSSPKGLLLLGKYQLQQALKLQDQFNSIKLLSKGQELEKSLATKLRLLKELENRFTGIMKIGGESGLGALYFTAKTYASLSTEILEAPIPSDLTAEQVDHYRKELKSNFAEPFKGKALLYTEQCLEKTYELALISTYTGLCLDLASQLNPERFPSQTKLNGLPQIISLLTPEGETLREAFPRKIPSKDSRASGTVTWASLNQLRQTEPESAVREIRSYLRKHPNELPFQNLLAIAYLESGDTTSAKVTLLSLLAQGADRAEIYNNLAVIESLRGNRNASLSYFTSADEKGSIESSLNRGFLALGARNFVLAEELFDSVLEKDSFELAKMGKTLCQVQKGALDIQEGISQLDESNRSLVEYSTVQNTPSSRELANEAELDSFLVK